MISGDTPASRGWVRETLESGGYRIWESGETFPEAPEGPAFIAQEDESGDGLAVFLDTDLTDVDALNSERVDGLMENVGGDPEAYQWLVWLGDGIRRTRERVTEDPPKGFDTSRLGLWVWIPNDMMSEVGEVIENLGFEPDWQRVPSGGIMIKFAHNEARALQELNNKLYVPPDVEEPEPEDEGGIFPEPEEEADEEPAGEMLGESLDGEPEATEIGPDTEPEPEPEPEPIGEAEAPDEAAEPEPEPEPAPTPPPRETAPSWKAALGVLPLDILFILGPTAALFWTPGGLLLALGVAGWAAGLTRLLSDHARHDQSLPRWWFFPFLPFPWTTAHFLFRGRASRGTGLTSRVPVAAGTSVLFLLLGALTATGLHAPFTDTLLGPVDAWGDTYLDHAHRQASEGFGIAKVVNATASVVRESPVPGLDLALGERLDPVDDAAERMASTMLFGFGALFLLELTGVVASQIAIPVLVPVGLALALIGSWLPRGWRPGTLRLGGHILVAALLLRLLVPAVGLAGAAVDNLGLETRFSEAMADMPAFVKEPGAPGEAPGSTDMEEAPGLQGEIRQLEAASRDMLPALRELTMVLLVRTLVVPLLVAWAFLRLFRRLTRPTTA